MADKDLGRKTFESLAKASLSVRYTRLVNGQASSGTEPVAVASHSSDFPLKNTVSARPQLRTVVEACPPASMKGRLGFYQGRIRMLQSPSWLIEAQRHVREKNGHDSAGEKFIAAGNALLDLCRFAEIMLNETRQKGSMQVAGEAAQGLEEKLGAIWSDLYLAVERLKVDCKRSRGLVSHAAVELLDLGVELENGRSYPPVLAETIVPQLEMLSAGIADAYEALPRIPWHAKEKSKSIKNVLSPNHSIARKGEAEKRIGVLANPNNASNGLAREIAVICDAVNALVSKLDGSGPGGSETIGMLKLCAARLKTILSTSYSLKRWEIELHRAHYIFRQAARQLPVAQEKDDQNTSRSSKNLPYGRMADYICDRFEDTAGQVLRETDPGYASHHFIIRKKNVLAPSQALLRSHVTKPVLRNAVVKGASNKPKSQPGEKHPGAGGPDLQFRPLINFPATAMIVQPSGIVGEATPFNPNVVSVIGTGGAVTATTEGKGKQAAMPQTTPTRHVPVPVRRQSGVRAATMSVCWQEIQSLSDQQRSEKKRV